MVLAAPGKTLVDFGLRRTHGAEAGLLAARAALRSLGVRALEDLARVLDGGHLSVKASAFQIQRTVRAVWQAAARAWRGWRPDRRSSAISSAA